MKTLLSTIGRWLFALPFGIFGIFHLMNGSQMAAMVPIPGKIFWIYFIGVCLILACVSFLIKKYDRYAGISLGILLLLFVFLIHLPGLENVNPQMAQLSMTMLLKDVALAGGAFMMAGQAKS